MDVVSGCAVDSAGIVDSIYAHSSFTKRYTCLGKYILEKVRCQAVFVRMLQPAPIRMALFSFYPIRLWRRYVAGGMPISRLNALRNAASDA